jgi:hypothetical protein
VKIREQQLESAREECVRLQQAAADANAGREAAARQAAAAGQKLAAAVAAQDTLRQQLEVGGWGNSCQGAAVDHAYSNGTADLLAGLAMVAQSQHALMA